MRRQSGDSHCCARGRTIAGLGCTGQRRHTLRLVRRVPPPHCYRCPWNKHPESCALECAQAMEQAIAAHHANLAAVLIEPFVLGPGGVRPGEVPESGDTPPDSGGCRLWRGDHRP